MALFWPRRGLRTVDNRGSARSAEDGRVVWSADYAGLARERAGASARRSTEQTSIPRSSRTLLHEPGSVQTNAGDPHQVFSPFRNE
jgi:deoxyribodipyrimidine photo-lyase